MPDGAESFLPFGDNLPAGAAHSIDIILGPNTPVSIWYWDGTGSVNWQGVQNNEYFDIEGNGGSGGILDGGSALNGIVLDSPAANGSFDTHPDFLLYGDGGTVDPTTGFYVLFGQTNIAGLTSSDPWAVVYDFGIENEVLHEAAVDDIVGILPEPTAGTMLLFGLAGLATAGRKQR